VTPSFLRITRVPPGEAPLWVRRGWVGLELPLEMESSAPVNAKVFGVMSAPQSPFARAIALLMGRVSRVTGFVVDPRAAVAILERADPDAAAWWRQYGAHMLQPGRHFVFPDDVGEVITRDASP
jgi:hypothetical protein